MEARDSRVLLLSLGGGIVILAFLAASPLLDGLALKWARGHASGGFLRLWAHAAYLVGLGIVQYVFLFLGALACWLTWRRAHIITLAVGALGVGLSGILTQVVKHLVGRPRPYMNMDSFSLAGPVWSSDLHSFPSGHTATSFALACILAARFPKQAWLIYGLAVLVGVGRILSGNHYVSDVMGGVLVGLAVALPLRRLISKNREHGV